MGFFDGLGRFLNGQPVFQNDKELHEEIKPADSNKTPLDSHGRKIIPKLELSHMHTHRNGQDMTTTVWITNASEQKVRIDYSYVLGQKQQFNRELGPEAGHEFVIYRGRVAKNEHDHRARIVYRLMANGDLFEEEYFVEFNRESDGAYLLEEFHEEGPTRDI